MSKETKRMPLDARGKELEFLIMAKEKHRYLLMSKRNVIGIGVGYRTHGGKVAKELAVKVYVSRKIPKDQLAESDLVPSTLDFEKRKVGVDVEEGKVPIAQIFTLRSRPLIGGSSIGPANIRLWGTLGVCLTLDDGQTYILSNNHVLSAVNQLLNGANIIQPSLEDGGSATNDVIATLTNAPAIDFGTTTITILGRTYTLPNRNYVDCALAQVQRPPLPDPGSSFNNANREIHWIGYPAFRTLDYQDLSFWEMIMMFLRPVHKMGRTTEYTVGTVVDVAWDGNIDYSHLFGNPWGTNLAWFENQLKIVGNGNRPFSLPGDSGSLILDAESNRPVGLLFAGDGTYTFANHITPVMNALGIGRV